MWQLGRGRQHHRHLLRSLGGTQHIGALAINAHTALQRFLQSGHRAQQGRLSHTIASHKAGKLSGMGFGHKPLSHNVGRALAGGIAYGKAVEGDALGELSIA